MPKGVYPRTEYHRELNRIGHLGQKNPNRGCKNKWKYTLEQRIAMAKRFSGKNGSNWRGGKTPASGTIRRSLKYRLWQEAVFKRDNYVCQICRKSKDNEPNIKMTVDHILPFALFPKTRFDLNNGRVVCRQCHYKLPTHGSGSWRRNFAGVSNAQ